MSKVRFVDSSIRVNSGGGTGGGDSSISASYALSASFAQTASYLLGSVTSASYAVTSSYAEYAVSASHEITKEVSSSYADTASLALSGNGPFTGSFTGSFIGNGTGLFSGSFSGSIPDAYQIISGSVSASISPNNGLKVNSGVEISLESGSAFSVIEEDAEAAYKNRLDFAYDQQDPTLTITARSATSLLHLKTGGASTGTTYNSQGQIIRNSAGVNYGITIGTGFNPSLGNQMTLGFYNRRWKNLYINTGDKISFGVNDSLNVDLVSLRHTVGTNELVISGSSDVTLDVKGNIISTGSLQVSGSVDIAIPSGSAFTITETDKDQTGRLDFTFDDGDPTLEIEGRSAVAKLVLSNNDGDSNNLKIQSDGQVFASSAGPYTGSIKFLPNGIEAISVGTSASPFIGSQTRPFYKYYMAQVGGQFISLGTYSKQQLFLNSSATGTQRSDGLYNQTSGIRFVVSGSEISGADGYLRNPNNQYFQIQDNSTGTGNNASIPFRVGKSGSLAINLNQSKGFGFAQYYTASAMVHVEAEPNYDLNLFQGNDVLGNNVFEVDRDGNLTVDAEISASGDLYARDGRFSRDGGAAEIEILASEIAGGIVGTQTSDHLHLRRFNINKFSLTDVKNISHQRLYVEGDIEATGIISASKMTVSASSDAEPGYTFWNNSTTGMLSTSPTNLKFQIDGTGSPELELNTGQTIFRTPISLTDNEISGVSRIRALGSISASGDFSSSISSTASFGTYLGDGSQLTGIEAGNNLTQSIFVTQNGDDTTGEIGNMSKPFATLASASQAATTGSTIFVYPGLYVAPAENLAFEGGSYYFYPNTVVSKSAAGPVFNSKNYSIGFNVYGHADFYLTSSCEEVIEAGNSSAPTPSYTFECQDITQLCGGDYAIVTTVDNGNITTDIAVANIKFRKLKTDGSGISIPGPYSTEKGNYFINCNEIYADVGGIYSYQGYSYLELNATRIVANGGAGIRSYYGYNTNINVGYLYGTTYGYDSFGTGYININSSYVSGINNVASIITLNGHCAKLDTSGGTFIGTSFEGTGTWSGGNNDVKLTPTYTEFLTISGGNHRINAGGSSNYFPYISIQGGLTYIDGYQTSGNSNYNYNISGGELIWDGHMKFSTNDNGQNFPFNLSGGVLRIKGHVENSLMDSEPTPQEYSCVYYNGGTLILDGATLLTSASFAPPVRVVGQDREVKIYSGGVNTNKTGSMGLLAASSSFGSGGYALTNPLGGMIIEDASIE